MAALSHVAVSQAALAGHDAPGISDALGGAAAEERKVTGRVVTFVNFQR
jgi:hypothetical protein